MAGRAAVDPGTGEAAARRWEAPGRRPGGPVPGTSRLLVVETAGRVVRGQPRHRPSPVHRSDRSRAVGKRLHHRLLNQRGIIRPTDWSRAVVDSIAVRAEKGGPNPVGRRKRARDPHGVRPPRDTADGSDHRGQRPRLRGDGAAAGPNSPRSAAGAEDPGTRPASCTPTRRTTRVRCAPRSVAEASPPVTASKPPTASAGTAGSPKPACPGYCVTAASYAATTAKPPSSPA